jgi:hypothetical protein
MRLVGGIPNRHSIAYNNEPRSDTWLRRFGLDPWKQLNGTMFFRNLVLSSPTRSQDLCLGTGVPGPENSSRGKRKKNPILMLKLSCPKYLSSKGVVNRKGLSSKGIVVQRSCGPKGLSSKGAVVQQRGCCPKGLPSKGIAVQRDCRPKEL